MLINKKLRVLAVGLYKDTCMHYGTGSTPVESSEWFIRYYHNEQFKGDYILTKEEIELVKLMADSIEAVLSGSNITILKASVGEDT